MLMDSKSYLKTIFTTASNFVRTHLIQFLRLMSASGGQFKDFTFLNVFPTVIFMALSVFYSWKMSRSVVLRIRFRYIYQFLLQKTLFFTCLFNIFLLWLVVVSLLDRLYLRFWPKLEEIVLKNDRDLKGIGVLDPEFGRCCLLSVFALSPLFVVIALKIFLNCDVHTQTIRFPFIEFNSNEQGNSIAFIYSPIRPNVRCLLNSHDQYYLQLSGRHMIRRKTYRGGKCSTDSNLERDKIERRQTKSLATLPTILENESIG